jgi:hypothetical protein
VRRDSGSPQGEHIFQAVNSLPSSQMEAETVAGLGWIAEAAHEIAGTEPKWRKGFHW